MERPTWEIPKDPQKGIYQSGRMLQRIRFKRFKKNNREDKVLYYKKIYEIVDSKELSLRKGDIFRFEDNPVRDKLPSYAIGQFAVILERYRVIKYKEMCTFYDYYAVIMMLSGIKKGHIRKISSDKINGGTECI